MYLLHMFTVRTTSNSGSGSGGSGSNKPPDNPGGNEEGHSNVGTRVVLPIVLIVVILVLAGIFGLWFRRVLHRSVLGPRRIVWSRSDRDRPTIWNVHLSRPEARSVPLEEIRVRLDSRVYILQHADTGSCLQPVALHHHKSKRSVDRGGTNILSDKGTCVDDEKDLKPVVNIAMPMPAHRDHTSRDSKMPAGLSFGVLELAS